MATAQNAPAMHDDQTRGGRFSPNGPDCLSGDVLSQWRGSDVSRNAVGRSPI